MVVPAGEPIHMVLTSNDVAHAFYVPAFLFKRDAIPGHPNEFDLTDQRARLVRRPVRGVLRGVPRPDAADRASRDPPRVRGVACRPRGAVGGAIGGAERLGGRLALGDRLALGGDAMTRSPTVAAGLAIHPAVVVEPTGLTGWLTTVDHKRIGILYIVTAFAMFLVGGAMAELMRAELAAPGLQVVGEQGFNQLFTMHGTIMLLLFGTPMAIGLANYIVPLQIGAADMAFPRLNALRTGCSFPAALIVLGGFLVAGGPAASAGPATRR